MARIRSAKPEWWSKEKWAAVPRDVRFTYKGIWEVMADDDGRFQADARLIKAQVWPLDDDITAKKIEKWLGVLESVTVTDRDGTRSPALVLYEADGIRYGFLPGFVKHQKISHPSLSKLPAPPARAKATSRKQQHHPPPGNPPEDSGALPESLAPEEERRGLGVGEGLGSGEEGADAQQPPPRVVLPQEADAFLAQFYEPCLTPKHRDRYGDIKRQLYDVLDPKHPGPKIRGGARVKARSVEHLVDTLRAVMKDPPPDRDLAIVWLLKKLLDPPKGPSVTEAAKRAEEAERATEDRYFAEAKAAGVKWAQENPEAYEPICRAVDANYNGRGGSFAKTAKESELTQRCARAAGFPNFEEWIEQKHGGRQLAAAGSGT